MTSTSESLLIELRGASSSNGRVAAWYRFVQLYTPLLYSWGREIGLTRDDAADLAQDVFSIVSRKISSWQYDPQRSFRGWLRTIALNRYREISRRKRIRTVSATEELLQQIPDDRKAGESWDRDYENRLIRSAIESAQPGFEPSVWQALMQTLSSDKPVPLVAKETGISVWTLYSARSRLFSKLRRELNGLMD